MIQNDNILARKGDYKIYASNPSILGAVKPKGRKVFGTDKQGMVIDHGTGEILGHGGAMMYKWQEIDNERFVKVYLDGLKQAVGLSKAGLTVFEIVYKQLQSNKNQDTVQLSVLGSGLAKPTYHRGLRELLLKEFLFKTAYDDTYFVNIQYMFNGDRLAFVQGYYRKGTPNPMTSALKLAFDDLK